MGGIISWWFDCFAPSIALTTAPTDRQVRDLLWKEVRTQRGAAGLKGFLGPRVPRLERSADHFAHGFTAKESDAFQGHHGPHILIAFDEAVGVNKVYWETANTMFAGEGHAWLAIFNPTDSTSQAYMEEMEGGWHVITMSSVDHPNIIAELSGLPAPYPSAVRLQRLDTLLRQWCTQVSGHTRSTDVRWPRSMREWDKAAFGRAFVLSGYDAAMDAGGETIHLRPGPIAEARLLGRWPSQGTYGIWSDSDWMAATTRKQQSLASLIPQIGCDVARFGDDFTAIHVRIGPKSLHHESFNGAPTDYTAGRLKRLAIDYGEKFRVNPKNIPIIIDDTGIGGGVVDQRGDYLFLAMNGSWKARRSYEYPNRRSELWFDVAELARDGHVDMSDIPASSLHEIRRQALAPTWKMDNQGRRVVERKEETKDKIGRSPDDMDGVNLAYAGYQDIAAPDPLDIKPRSRPHEMLKDSRYGAHRRGLFGSGERVIEPYSLQEA